MRLVEVDLLLFTCIYLAGCSQHPPIPADKFIDVYVSLQLVSAANEGNASMQKVKADSVMRSFEVSDSLLESTISWYVSRPEEWQNVLAEANRKLTILKNEELRHVHR